MPYKSGSWGPEARRRSRSRTEYFKRYVHTVKNKPCIDRFLPVYGTDSLGVVGEKIALEILVGSEWVGELHDIVKGGKKIEVKTSKPHTNGGHSKWKFDLHRQFGKVDKFLLICLDEHLSVVKIYLIPGDTVTRYITVSLTSPKYAEYIINIL